jgi:hypothetical protein
MRVLLCLLFGLALAQAAQAPVYVSSPSMRCGMVRRASEMVQIWCWSGIVYNDSTALYNALHRVTIESPLSLGFYESIPDKAMAWSLEKVGEVINYRILLNSTEVATGTLW